MQINAIKTNSIWFVEIISHVHDSILFRSRRLLLIFFKISSWSYQELHLYKDKAIDFPVSLYESRLWNEGSIVIQLNSRVTTIKDHVINVKIYISFTRYLHDLKMERGSRDNTRFQIEDSDSPYRDTCHDLKNVVVTAVASGKDNTCGITITTTTLSFQKTTTRLDARHCAKNDAASRSWTLGQDRILLETDVLTTHAELFVALRALDECCERSVLNISRERLIKNHYSDHVKSQYSLILRHISRSWIYFVYQK